MHLICTHFALYHGSCDVIASLDCIRLTCWPVAWNWRRAVLSADAGFLVLQAGCSSCCTTNSVKALKAKALKQLHSLSKLVSLDKEWTVSVCGLCNVCCLQVLYVLYFHRDSEKEVVKAVSITEFLLAHPCLSLAVFNTKQSPVHGRPTDTAQVDSSHGWHLFLLNCAVVA